MKFLGTPFYRIPLVAASGCRNVEELKSQLRSCVEKGCAKFCGSRAIAGPLGLVPLCHRAIVPSSFFSLVFCGSKSFPRGYDVGSKFFSWVFRGSKTSFCGYELGPKFFLLGISWVQYFWSWLISWFKDFQFLVSWERVTGNRNTWIHLKPHIVFQIDFNNFQFCLH